MSSPLRLLGLIPLFSLALLGLWERPAQADEPEVIMAEGEEPAEPPAEPGVTPRYVVWRIKAGTGAGALAPKMERRLRTALEQKLGSEMLSKAAQTGIILIRPELADCDANLPCALDVAEALHIRFVVGGEAEGSDQAKVTAWVVDLEQRAETRRVTLPMTEPGEAGEVRLATAMADALLAPPKVAAVDAANKPAPTQDTASAPSRGGKPVLASVLGGAAVMLAVTAIAGLAAGALAMTSGGIFTYVRTTFHTRSAANAQVGSFVTGGVLLGIGVLLALGAVPLAALGGLAMMDLQ